MKSEKDLIRSKYENAYPNLFQNMTDSLDNESMAYGDYLNKNTKYKQGSTPQLVSKMWDVDGLSIEYNKYINDINNCRDQIENSKYTVLSCSNLQQADVAFNKIYSGYQNFLAKWKNETSISSNKWIGHFDKLLIGQQVVQPVQNIIPQQIVPQNNEDLLKKIKEFEEVLKQALFENTSLKDQNVSLKDQNTSLKDQLKTSQDTVNDQKIVIGDLREDKKDLKEKVNVQKVEIDHLKEDLSVQIEKVQEFTDKYHNVSDKYVGLKTHFNELVIKHHVFDGTYEPPIELAGDND
jgi:DNA repair exonuclease SbcCD ATPase subunit